jgi:type I restriction enzyme S subunit
MKIYPTKKLGEVVKIQNGFAFRSSEYVDSGFFVMRITNVQDGFIELNNPKYIREKGDDFKKFVLNPNDILVSLTGNVGRVGIIQKEHLPAVLNQRVARIVVTDPDLLDQKYLFNFLKSPFFISKVIEMGHGMAQKNVSTKDIENLQIPLPSFAEQKKIVSKLEKVLGKIKEAKKLRSEAEETTKNLIPAELHKIFSEGEKKGWEEKELGDETILKITSGGTPSRSDADFYNGEIPWLKSGELEDNANIINSEEKISKDAVKKSSTKIFPKGAVLFAMYGATAGKIGMLDIEACTNQAVAGMIPVAEKLNNKFLYYFLMQKRAEIISQAWGGAQPNLSQTIIKKFKISLPSLAEQKKIVARLNLLSEKIKKLQDYQKSAKSDLISLEQLILSSAFSGELDK